jgi:hypothetical protein
MRRRPHHLEALPALNFKKEIAPGAMFLEQETTDAFNDMTVI